MAGTATTTGRKGAARRARARGRRGIAGLFAGVRAAEAELLLVIALFGAALLVRWPYLLRLPHFTDETVEIEWALAIWRGEILPLTASDRYYGPLHPYLVAAALALFGPSTALPRVIVMVFGAATVALTYLLARALAGRAVGLLGAALLATAPQHVIVNSHVAWQNSTTPFYATLTFLGLTLYLNAEREARSAPPGSSAPQVETSPTPRSALRVPHSAWIVVAGFCYGLTLHTHVGTIVLAPALALTVLAVVWRAGAWRVFRTPWPWLAPMATILAYSPVLIYNLQNNLAGVQRVQTRRSYAYEMQLTWEKYWQNVGDFWLQALRIVSNPMRIPQERWHYFTSPYLLLMAGLCAAGLLLLARRGQPLPLLALLSTAAIMPAFNKAYGQGWDRYLLTGRYVTFLLPLALIAAATAATALAGWLPRALPAVRANLRLRWATVAAAVALLVLLVAYPLQPLARYYTHEAAQDPDNASFLVTVDFVKSVRGPRTPVLLDGFLYKVDLKDGADALGILSTLFTLEGIPHRIVDDPGEELGRIGPTLSPNDTEALPIIVMMYDRCYPIRDQVPLQQISDRYRLRELYWTKPSFYAVYRYAPPPQKAGCFPP